MTIQEMFSSVKRYGYVADNKIDENGMEHGNNGQFVQKGKQTEFEYASKVPYETRTKYRNNLADKLKDYVTKGVIENSTIGTTKISKHTIGKLGSDKALNKSMANGFTPEEHFDAAERVVDLYKNAELKLTHPDKDNDPNIISIKRFNQIFITCNHQKARAWITVKESKQHGHRLYSIEVMEIEKAGEHPAIKSGAELNQSVATDNIAHEAPEVKSIAGLWNMIKQNKYL
ncbi:hypothetical protein [uncultured Treponema sp.]|jgi:hypothetical protein|uniref:LPD3 domain-containing protein n=1 Tax=uncultured Treponema sp. TaxID=162155 RepID=UPI00204FDAF2|nr:hypothetical protein [uncultured Treponema sp.]DAL19678.1 MAG TPA_asm: hypothetical protein [Caudoviricetes sp.]